MASTMAQTPTLTLKITKAQLSRLERDFSGPRPSGIMLETPSSTVVECGDFAELNGMSAVERADHLFKYYSTKSPNQVDQGTDESSDILMPLKECQPRPRLSPKISRSLPGRLSRLIPNILTQAVGEHKDRLSDENRILDQRLAAVRRNEQRLQQSNELLLAQLDSLRQSQESMLKTELQRHTTALEDKLKNLEQLLGQKNEQLSRLRVQLANSVSHAPPRSPGLPPAISGSDVASWFQTRSEAWSSWVDENLHQSPTHLMDLHPTQLQEVTFGVRHFVRLTDTDTLPPSLISSRESNDLLLRGMLTHFIVQEALASPFWIFVALSKPSLESNSPIEQATAFQSKLESVPRLPMSPVTPSFAINTPPAPTTARSISIFSPNRSHPSVAPLSPTLTIPRGAYGYTLPTCPEMDDLLELLLKTQPEAQKVHIWRAHLMQMLWRGGLSHPTTHPTLICHEDRQMLAYARVEYARQLKEKFLSSAARFFLRDQDSEGITNLEDKLVSEIDLALQFSAHLWSRVEPVRFLGLGDFRGEAGEEWAVEGEGRVVIMPVVGTKERLSGKGEVWVRGRVVESAEVMKEAEVDGDDVLTPVAYVREKEVVERVGTPVLKKEEVFWGLPKSPKPESALRLRRRISSLSASSDGSRVSGLTGTTEQTERSEASFRPISPKVSRFFV